MTRMEAGSGTSSFSDLDGKSRWRSKDICVGGSGEVNDMTGNAFTVFIGYAARQGSWKDKERHKRKETGDPGGGESVVTESRS